MGHALSFGQVLADQAISVFIQSAFPRMIGGAEIERYASGLLNVAELMKLGAVVSGNGFERPELFIDEVDEAFVGELGIAPGQLANNRIACLTLDQCDDAMLVVAADHGINLPMTDAGAVIGAGRSLGDVAFTGHHAAGIMGTVALSFSFAGLSQL